MAQLTDPTSAGLDAALQGDQVEVAAQARHQELLEGLAAENPPPEAGDEGHLAGNVISYLHHAQAWVEAQLQAEVQQWSPIRWLWYLRRLPPDVVHGQFAGSYWQLLRIAEIIASKSEALEHGALLHEAPFPTDAATALALVRYLVGVRLLARLQWAERRVKRGAEATFLNSPIPTLTEAEEVAAAIAYYDQRLSHAESTFFNRLGTVHLHDLAVPEGEAPPTSLLVAGPARESAWVHPLGGDGDEIWATHATTLKALAPLGDLIAAVGGPKWWSDAAPALVGLLCALTRIVDTHPELVAQVLGSGTAILRAEEFAAQIDAILADLANELRQTFPATPVPATSGELVAALADLPIEVWPATAGAPLFLGPDAVLIDVSAATRQLELALVPAAQVHAQTRARLFELAAQEIIDRSPWHHAGLAQHRGENVKRADDTFITDLDAIGGRGDQALIVDCKSYVYTGDYEAGPPGAMLNPATVLAQKAAHMVDTVLPDLHANRPEFLLPYPRLIGVVCTPVPLYTEIGDATNFAAPGLPRVVSLLELRDWLEAS